MSTSKNQQDFPHANSPQLPAAKLPGGSVHDADEHALLGVGISAGAGAPPPLVSADALRARLRRAERDESEPRTTLLPMTPSAPARAVSQAGKAPKRYWGPTKLLVAFAFGGLSGGSVYSLAEHAHAQQRTDGIESRALAATAIDPPAGIQKLAVAPPPTAAVEQASTVEPAAEEFTPTPAEIRHAAERSMLRTASAQLHAGEPFSAQATLQHLQKRFPRGKWAQRREVLSIQVQRVVGPPSAAKKAARAFAQAHPYSPHIAPLKPLLLDE